MAIQASGPEPFPAAKEAGAAIRERFGVTGLDAAFVLGSGWSAAADDLGEPIGSCELAELPGFAAPTVLGHGGALRVARTSAGKIVALDTPRELKLRYGSRTAAVLLRNREEQTISLDDAADAERLAGWMRDDQVLTMHSQEGTLEDVFIALAGRSL